MRVERNNIDRKVFSLKDFRGVDYASSPLEVKPYRATDMANLLLRDGQLQKRYGVKQKKKLGIFGYLEDGIRPLECKVFPPFQVGEQWFLVVQGIGVSTNKFFIYGIADETYTLINEISIPTNNRHAVFVNCGGSIYFVDRSSIYKFAYENSQVSLTDLNPYIPTTTINVPYTSYVTDGENRKETLFTDSNVFYPYQSNESLNMLTKMRKNILLVKRNPAEYVGFGGGFVLDSIVQMPTSVSDNLTPPPKLFANGLEFGEFKPKEYKDLTSLATFVNSVCWYNKEANVAIVRKRENTFSTPATAGFRDDTSVLVITNKAELATQLAAMGVKSAIEDYVSLTVQFNPEGYLENKDAQEILDAEVSATFGVDGADDRIFLSKGNKVYYSENTSGLEADITYFPVDQWLKCGLESSPITAMMRVSDGTLAIFKDVSAHEDVSVYYTSGYYESVGVGEEGNEYQRARFTVRAGDIRRTGISASTVANLEGDNIFTCKEGVYGIQLSDNVASGERYARERSRTINPKITQFDLHNARGIVYRDKYYLAVGNGEVYVADARYKFTMQGDQQNTFNYEWFRLTGLNVLEWFIYDDKLHFIDKDGYFCEFTDGFADQYLVTTDNHELTVNDDGTVTFNADRLPLVKASSYAIDNDGEVWEITLTKDKEGNDAIAIPGGIEIEDANDLDLWFCVPVTAYWQSAVMDLNSPMYLKNMWGLSMVASAKHGGKINLGYKTRMNAVSNIEVEGANEFAWGQAIDLFGGMQTSMLTGGEKSFGMYTFDVGGYVGINTYTRRIFDRNFAHIQLLFTSETTTDCAVAEMDIEYSIGRKNIGVG